MKDDATTHHRRSLRLKGYDYSQPGAYFVSVCAEQRECLFGEVVDEAMRLNDAGQMINRWWTELPSKFPNVEIDEYVVMPNHFHGIIPIVDKPPPIVGADPCVRPNQGAHTGAPLPHIMQWFKTMTTNEYIRGVTHHGWCRFPGKVWQRGYYEHVVRTEDKLNQIRQYIRMNPAQWAWDSQNPTAKPRPTLEASWQV